MTHIDICIIGGGPAGCVAARDLARAGFQVLVCEEHPTVGLPVDCSGVIGTEAFDRLSLPRETIRDTLQDIDFVSPSGKRVAFRPQRILAYLVDRAAFDVSLAQCARAAGSTIWTSACVKTVEPAEDHVRLTVRHHGDLVEVRAQAVVLAGGPRYRFQQQLGMGVPERYLKTVQAEVDGSKGGTPQIFLGSRVALGSFAWWLPVKSGDGYRAKVGISAVGDGQRAFQAFLDVLQDQGYLDDGDIPYRAWMLPITPLPRTYGDRVVVVGDAAGQTKPTTGGGLYYGPLCATIAAEVLIDGFRCGNLSAPFLAQYESRWRRLLNRELATAHRFRRLLECLSDAEIEQLFDLASQDGLLTYLQDEANFDWHRRTILQGALRLPAVATFLVRLRRRQLAELVS